MLSNRNRILIWTVITIKIINSKQKIIITTTIIIILANTNKFQIALMVMWNKMKIRAIKMTNINLKINHLCIHKIIITIINLFLQLLILTYNLNILTIIPKYKTEINLIIFNTNTIKIKIIIIISNTTIIITGKLKDQHHNKIIIIIKRKKIITNNPYKIIQILYYKRNTNK